RVDGVTMCALWLAGNILEGFGKLTITRPALYKAHVHAAAFDNSLPSGHTIRSLVAAAAIYLAWRARWAWLWALVVLVALVVTGAHTPTDIVAGVLVGVVLAGWGPPGLDPPKWGRTRVRGRRGDVERHD
ncbi:MAG TPA: phosphatase PAP2 family protein, partial [Acidimicrobiales bacterium]|nr:phosphatase PAP2 family protein [Acidimicrobiales bacterium]